MVIEEYRLIWDNILEDDGPHDEIVKASDLEAKIREIVMRVGRCSILIERI